MRWEVQSDFTGGFECGLHRHAPRSRVHRERWIAPERHSRMTGERFEQLSQIAKIKHQAAGRFVVGEFLSFVEHARVLRGEGERLVHRQRAERDATPAPLALKRGHHLPTFDARCEGWRQDDRDFQTLAVGGAFELWSWLRLWLVGDRSDPG